MQRISSYLALFALLVLWLPLGADIAPETMTVETLSQPQPHWVIVNDPNLLGYMDSKVYVIDADSGVVKGMISAGGARVGVEFSANRDTIYIPELYFSRTSRGTRTDVISYYDVKNLSPVAEVVIPPRRAAGVGMRAYHGASDDGRYLYIVNMTPAVSVSIVDAPAQKFVREVNTPGCNLVYPAGNTSFLMICGDGKLLHGKVDHESEVQISKTKQVFDALEDPLTEKAARIGSTWYFISFAGHVHPVRANDRNTKARKKWSLLSDDERAQQFRVGGGQFVAAHEKSGRLYVLVHKGGVDTHKQPGEAVWVFDAKRGKKLFEVPLKSPAVNIAVTQDDDPLLLTAGQEPVIHVFGAQDGAYRHAMEAPLLGAGLIQAFNE